MLRPRNCDYQKCRSCGGPTSYWASVSPTPSVKITCAKCGAYLLRLDYAGYIIGPTEDHRDEGCSFERLRIRSLSSDEHQLIQQSKATDPSTNPLFDFKRRQDDMACQSIPAYVDSLETINNDEKGVAMSSEKDGSVASSLSKNGSNVELFSRDQSRGPKPFDPGSDLSNSGYVVSLKRGIPDNNPRKLSKSRTAKRNIPLRYENQARNLIREPCGKTPLARTIVTCPRCGTLFQLDRSGIPEGHQLIRCSRCEHQWHQRIS